MTPLDLAKLNAQIYATSTDWLNYWQTDDVVVGHALVENQHVLVLRGSVTAEDWLRDGDAIPVWHPTLGFVHAGFLKGMDDVYATVAPVVGPNPVITGHSLGAARARILAALFAVNNIPVSNLCVFGSPRPAFANLARVIQKSLMPHSSYRNRNDPIPEVPFPFPLPYVHPDEHIALDAAPSPTDLEPLRDHHITLYVQGLTPVPVPA